MSESVNSKHQRFDGQVVSRNKVSGSVFEGKSDGERASKFAAPVTLRLAAEAPVDPQALSGDALREVRGKEGHGASNLFCRDQASQRSGRK